MTVAPLPHDETERLQVLHGLELLDTEPEPAFERIVELAKALFGVEVAMVALIDADRQWYKAKSGVEIAGTPRDVAFCAHTILSDATVWAEDMREDPRFSDNPFVTGEPHARFYAGAPIVAEGRRLGSVCVLDTRPRPFDPQGEAQLRALGAIVSGELELRRQAIAARRRAAADRGVVELLIRHAPVPLVMVDAELRVMQVSERWSAFYGRDPAEVVGRKMHDIFPAAREAWDPIYQRCLSGACEQGRRVSRTGDQERWLQWEAAPWRQADGAVGGLLLMNFDVTELVLAQRTAEAADRAKGQFLANITHEVKTPLNGVLGLAQALALTPLSAEQAVVLGLIESSAASLDRLLGDVLDLTGIEAQRLRPAREPTDVEALVREVGEDFSWPAREKGLAFAVEIEGSPAGLLSTDPALLRRVLSALLDNAVKYTEAGTVALRLSTERAGPRTRARFVVEDTGPGFAETDKERLFRAFEQADGSSTRRFGGAGLGLALCHSIARSLGGEMDAAARPGGGSAFSLTLDLEPACVSDGAVAAA